MRAEIADDGLFRGVGVVIDDEVYEKESAIAKIVDDIERHDCYLVRTVELPEEPFEMRFSDVAFVILDWDLSGRTSAQRESGVQVGSFLKDADEDANVRFLRHLFEIRPVPVFVFTTLEPEDVKRKLEGAELLTGTAADNIFVRRKKEVRAEGVFSVLNNWIVQHPGAYVLRKWEVANAIARNEFFVDLRKAAPVWPKVLWEAYVKDGAVPAAELAGLIGRNVIARLWPLRFSDGIITREVEPPEAGAIRAVLRGERFIGQSRLHPSPVTGDVFRKNGSYYINIRPDCDLIPRSSEDLDDVLLYLVKGSKMSRPRASRAFSPLYGRYMESDVTCIVASIGEDESHHADVEFYFKKFCVERWGDWKTDRIGRVTAPHLTRLQQRFAAFMQRVGLNRTPLVLSPVSLRRLRPKDSVRKTTRK